MTGNTLLIVGGSGEAYRLAERCAGRPGLRVISSLAGVTRQPRRPAGELRLGGFGGPAGLRRYLAAQRVDWVIDASHPFAQTISASVAEACAAAGVALLRLCRPPWQEQPGDRWTVVPDLAAAAAALPRLGRRVLLAGGGRGLAPLARGPAARLFYLLRLIEPPVEPPPMPCRLLLMRGPFSVADELALLREQRIDVVLAKNSGGAASYGKIAAARQLGLPVVMLARPAAPVGAVDVDEALRWLSRQRQQNRGTSDDDRV